MVGRALRIYKSMRHAAAVATGLQALLSRFFRPRRSWHDPNGLRLWSSAPQKGRTSHTVVSVRGAIKGGGVLDLPEKRRALALCRGWRTAHLSHRLTSPHFTSLLTRFASMLHITSRRFTVTPRITHLWYNTSAHNRHASVVQHVCIISRPCLQQPLFIKKKNHQKLPIVLILRRRAPRAAPATRSCR